MSYTWHVRDLEEDAKEDEEIAQLLEGTGGDPDAIRRRVRMCFRFGAIQHLVICLHMCCANG